MNEEALKDAYGLFTGTGYKGSYEDFVGLMNSNSDALNDAYGLFKDTGYNGSIDQFSDLMGVKKKDDPQVLEQVSQMPVEQAYQQYPNTFQTGSTSASVGSGSVSSLGHPLDKATQAPQLKTRAQKEIDRTGKVIRGEISQEEAQKQMEGELQREEDLAFAKALQDTPLDDTERPYAQGSTPEDLKSRIQFLEDRDSFLNAGYDKKIIKDDDLWGLYVNGVISEDDKNIHNRRVDVEKFIENDFDWNQSATQGVNSAEDFAFTYNPETAEGDATFAVKVKEALSENGRFTVTDADIDAVRRDLRNKYVSENRDISKDQIISEIEKISEEEGVTPQEALGKLLMDKSDPYLDESSRELGQLNREIQSIQLSIAKKKENLAKADNEIDKSIIKLGIEGDEEKLNQLLRKRQDDISDDDIYFDSNYNVVDKENSNPEVTNEMRIFKNDIEEMLKSNDYNRLVERILDLDAGVNLYTDKYDNIRDERGNARMDSEAMKEYQSLVARLRSLSNTVVTQQDPSKLKSEGWWELADGFLSGLGLDDVVRTNREEVQTLITDLSELGLIRDQDIERAKGTTSEKIGFGTGLALETITEMALESAITEGIGAPAATARGLMKLRKAFGLIDDSKSFAKMSGRLYDEARMIGFHGVSPGTMIVEGVTEDLLKKVGVNKLLDNNFGKWGFAFKLPVKAGVMTIPEAVGELAIEGDMSLDALASTYITMLGLGAVSSGGIGGKNTVESELEFLKYLEENGADPKYTKWIKDNSPYSPERKEDAIDIPEGTVSEQEIQTAVEQVKQESPELKEQLDDAIQERQTEEMDVRQQARDGETVEQRKEEIIPTEEVQKQEEITTEDAKEIPEQELQGEEQISQPETQEVTESQEVQPVDGAEAVLERVSGDESWDAIKADFAARRDMVAAGDYSPRKHTNETKKQLREAISDRAKDIREAKITTTKTLLDKIASASDRNLESVISYVDDVIRRSTRARKTREVRSAQKKLPKAMKNLPPKIKETGKMLESLNPKFIDDPAKITEAVDEYLDAVKGKGGSPERVVELLNELQAEQEVGSIRYRDERALEEYEASGLKDDMTFEEYQDATTDPDSLIPEDTSIQESLDSEFEIKRSKPREKLERIVAFRRDFLADKLKNQENLTKDQRETLNILTDDSIDLTELPVRDLKEMNNIISEIDAYDSYAKSGAIKVLLEAKKKGKAIGKRYKGKVALPNLVTSKATRNLINVPNFFKAIAGAEGGYKLKIDLMGQLDQTAPIAGKRSDNYNVGFDEIAAKIKGNKEEAYTKIQMIAFLEQNDSGMSDIEKAEDFKAKKSFIELQLDKMKELSAAKNISSPRQKTFKKLAKDERDVYDKYIKDLESKDQAVESLSDAEAELYDYIKKSAGDIKDDLFSNYEKFQGVNPIEVENYSPTIARPIETFESLDIEKGGISNFNPTVDVKHAGSTINRTSLPTKNPDGTAKSEEELEGVDIKHMYLFNAELASKQRMKEAYYDIETLEARKLLNDTLNTPEVKKALGPELHKELKRRLGDKIATQRGTIIDGLKEMNTAAKAFFTANRYTKMTKLRTWDQWVKQPMSIVTHSIGTIGARPTSKSFGVMYDVITNKESRDNFNKLIATSEIANRVTQGEWIIENQKSISDAIFGGIGKKLGKVGKGVEKAYENIFAGALEKGDNIATRGSWLAAYIKALKDSGKIKSVYDFNLEDAAKNPDPDAIAYADSLSQDINNASDFSDSAKMFKSSDKKYIREALYNFRSFSVNMMMRNLIAVRDLRNKDALEVDKKAAMRQLVGSAMAVMTFQAMKIYLLDAIYDEGIEWLYGLEDEDETDENKLRKLVANSLADYLVGGAPGGEITEETFKQASNVAKEKITGEERDNLYYTGGDGALGYLPGSYEMTANIPLEIYDNIEEITTDIKEDDEISEKEAARMGSLIAVILGEGSADRFLQKSYNRLRKEERSQGRSRKKRKTRIRRKRNR